MSGLLLTMVCLILSAITLTMGPLPVESKPTGIKRDLQIEKRGCSTEEGRRELRRCGKYQVQLFKDLCRKNVDLQVSRTCGARKRSYETAESSFPQSASFELADRGQHSPSEVHRGINLNKLMEWR